MIELDSKEISLKRQCELLNISRFSLYYQEVEAKQEDIFIMNCIDEIHNDFPGFGVALINDRLNKKYGIKIGLKRTRTYLEIMAISEGESVYSHTYYPYLLKKLNIERPNQVWSIDISYIGLMYDFAYLVVVIDWFSRYVVSWELSHTLEVDFVIQAVKKAIDKYVNPDILNSDNGSQFVAADYCQLLIDNNITISRNRKGKPTDNISVERFFKSIKEEKLYHDELLFHDDALKSINFYIPEYNQYRGHKKLKSRTPAEVYFQGRD